MKVLVTGGAGFIGSHVVDDLVKRGTRVHVLDNLSTGLMGHLKEAASKISFFQGDVADPADVRRALEGITHVVHLAAMRSIPKSLINPSACNQANVTGTLNIFQAAREAKVNRVVFASSSSVYGDAGDYPATEEIPLNPKSPYAASKQMGEIYARLFRELFGLDIVCLRYFNVYGPRMDLDSDYAMAVPRFTSNMLQDQPAPVYGDGLQSRDFIFVEDVARVTVDALSAAPLHHTTYNIGAGQGHTLLRLIEIINQQLGKNIPPRLLPARAGESRKTLADISRARQDFKFAPEFSFEQGLQKTIRWFRQSLEQVR
ncbi:MAG: SDR family NAD(P)-dependent oxidoreductase [Candidatus Omnitrophica bacterium]|nr:SDR family NAD(P)-dependent oxidoreductase [Candidatus Omnitrophota bacterium]